MVDKGPKKGTARFALNPDNGARVVELAGSFSDWQPIRMKKRKGGCFVSIVPVAGGTHEYKFIIDGEWTPDPDNNIWAMNKYGTLNSILTVA
jgi:5'-AMP-activated protein kinase regulatory beta subunit